MYVLEIRQNMQGDYYNQQILSTDVIRAVTIPY